MADTPRNHRISFGVGADGQMHAVRDVPRGAACRCICAQCRQPLVARKGHIRRHHFAHAPGVTPCDGGPETALHQMAKQILGEAASIRLPALSVWEPDELQTGQSPRCKAVVTDAETMAITGRRIESSEDRFRPDVVVWDGARELWLEVRVAHRVSEYKHDELRRRGIGCLEIDVRNLDPEHVSVEWLRQKLIDDTDSKVWLAHPEEAAARDRARAKWEATEKARLEFEGRPWKGSRAAKPARPAIVTAHPADSEAAPPRVSGPPRYRWLVCPECRHMGKVDYDAADAGRRFQCSACGRSVYATDVLQTG